MCNPMFVMIGASIASAAVSARSASIQGQVANATAKNNQIMAEYAAKDATKRGEEQAMEVARRGRQLLGSQRAGMAAKGLDLGEGTAAELQDQTSFFADSDVRTVRENAKRDAWSMRQQGQAFRAQGDAALAQGQLAQWGSILNGASSVASKWYGMN